MRKKNRNSEYFPVKLQLKRIRRCNCNCTDTWSRYAVHQFHTSIFSRIYVEKDYIYLVKSIPCSILKFIFFRLPGKTVYE